MPFESRPLNEYPLNLIQSNLVSSPIVQLRRSWRFMRGNAALSRVSPQRASYGILPLLDKCAIEGLTVSYPGGKISLPSRKEV